MYIFNFKRILIKKKVSAESSIDEQTLYKTRQTWVSIWKTNHLDKGFFHQDLKKHLVRIVLHEQCHGL